MVCPICQLNTTDITLECNHDYHKACLGTNLRCRLCNLEQYKDDFIPYFVISDTMPLTQWIQHNMDILKRIDVPLLDVYDQITFKLWAHDQKFNVDKTPLTLDKLEEYLPKIDKLPEKIKTVYVAVLTEMANKADILDSEALVKLSDKTSILAKYRDPAFRTKVSTYIQAHKDDKKHYIRLAELRLRMRNAVIKTYFPEATIEEDLVKGKCCSVCLGTCIVCWRNSCYTCRFLGTLSCCLAMNCWDLRYSLNACVGHYMCNSRSIHCSGLVCRKTATKEDCDVLNWCCVPDCAVEKDDWNPWCYTNKNYYGNDTVFRWCCRCDCECNCCSCDCCELPITCYCLNTGLKDVMKYCCDKNLEDFCFYCCCINTLDKDVHSLFREHSKKRVEKYGLLVKRRGPKIAKTWVKSIQYCLRAPFSCLS